jgi:hypothetical protein
MRGALNRVAAEVASCSLLKTAAERAGDRDTFAHAFVGQAGNMLEQKKPITNRVAIPGRPLSLYSGAISPSMNSQSILPASCTSSCLMLMIWSSRARNRSPDPDVPCFFGRIAPSDAATESRFSIRGNPENEIASFQGLRP